MIAPTANTQTIVRHPIRGGVWGLLLGLSLALWALLYKFVAFGDWVILAILVAAGVLVGILWSVLAPPKRPKGAPPTQVGGGYVPVQQQPAVQQVPPHQAGVQPPTPQTTTPQPPIPQAAPPQPATPTQEQYAPMSGVPSAAPPPQTTPPVVPPTADDLQPGFLVDEQPPSAGDTPTGSAQDTIVARPDDIDGGGSSPPRS